MSWAADGQDRNGLQLEKNDNASLLGKLGLRLILSSKLLLIFSIFLLVFHKHFMYDRGI